jgi:protein-S-isoprenylcysteine O-methyltransferase Ste14
LAKESPVVREHPVERSLAELGMSDPPWRKPEHVNAQTKKLESIVRMILALKNILFTLVVPGTVGVYLPLILARGQNAATDFFLGLAIIFFLIGGSIYSWCVFDFASFGRGTPAPIDAPKKLVRRGLYRYSRNPMYVGVLTVIYGWAILYQSIAVAVYGIVVACCFYSFVVFFEEPILKKRFGAEYEQYCVEVARWLFR